MDAVQRLRARAQANNKLMTTKEQKVSVRQEMASGGRRHAPRQVIAIEPAVPDEVYVPYYDPAVVYGAWPYDEYPPYYFGYPDYIGPGIIGAGLAFGAAWGLGRWALGGGRFWGGGVNWNRNHVSHHNGAWAHNPAHRQGVRYNNAGVAQRFGNRNLGNRNLGGAQGLSNARRQSRRGWPSVDPSERWESCDRRQSRGGRTKYREGHPSRVRSRPQCSAWCSSWRPVGDARARRLRSSPAHRQRSRQRHRRLPRRLWAAASVAVAVVSVAVAGVSAAAAAGVPTCG